MRVMALPVFNPLAYGVWGSKALLKFPSLIIFFYAKVHKKWIRHVLFLG